MPTIRQGAIALVLTAAVAGLTGCGSSDDKKTTATQTPIPKTTPDAPTKTETTAETPKVERFRGIAYPNVDIANTRSTDGPITRKTVEKLEEAWSLPLTAKSAYGSYSSSPVVADGVVYSQDLVSDVQAIDLKTGEVLWSKEYASPDQGPNGLVVADGRVFGATATSAFALDQKTGEELWSKELIRNSGEGIDMSPGYHDGLVYVSTVPGNNTKFYGGGGVGVLWALDAKTGKRKWTFNTVPKNLWKDSDYNSGGGLWHAPSFDKDDNMYFGVGNPAPFPGTESDPWGSSRPGKNLYTNSLVKLDAKTGKLRWYYQLTPHDLYDWDLQDPPILTTVNGREAVVTAGKGGIVIAVDRQSGELLWKRAVGKHNGHDKDGLLAMKGDYDTFKLPMEVYPGTLGGVIAPMSTDGKTLFVPVVNNSITFASQTQSQPSPDMTGELDAIDIDTGKITWKRKFDSAAFGATSVVNDLVFTATFDGVVHAFDTKTGKQAWEQNLPSGINTGVTIHDDTVLAPAGIAVAQGQAPALVAYRLGGKGK